MQFFFKGENTFQGTYDFQIQYISTVIYHGIIKGDNYLWMNSIAVLWCLDIGVLASYSGELKKGKGCGYFLVTSP